MPNYIKNRISKNRNTKKNYYNFKLLHCRFMIAIFWLEGNVMVTWKIPLYKIYWDEDDVRAVASVIRQGMIWATGSKITEFEQLIED